MALSGLVIQIPELFSEKKSELEELRSAAFRSAVLLTSALKNRVIRVFTTLGDGRWFDSCCYQCSAVKRPAEIYDVFFQ